MNISFDPFHRPLDLTDLTTVASKRGYQWATHRRCPQRVHDEPVDDANVRLAGRTRRP